MLVPWVDVWSVAAGPTEYVVEERPGLFENVAIAFPSPGEAATVNIGPPDILFFALFLAAAARFDLRVAATWIGMTACLAVTLALVWWWETSPGSPRFRRCASASSRRTAISSGATCGAARTPRRRAR